MLYLPGERPKPTPRISMWSLEGEILLHSESQAKQMQDDLSEWAGTGLTKYAFPDRFPPVPEVLHYALRTLQPDTLNELTRGMIRFLGFKKKRWDELDNTERGHVAVFALLSDIFNRGDLIIERTTAIMNNSKGSIMGSELLRQVYAKRPLIRYVDTHGQLHRLTTGDMLTYALDVGTALGIDTTTWPDTFNTMLSAQATAMDTLKKNNELQTITYSVDFALSYRQRTVAQYFRLLAQSLFDDPTMQQRLCDELLWIQRVDDFSDIYEDIWTQVNPYVALFHSNSILNEFIDYHYQYIYPRQNHVLLLWSTQWFMLRHPALWRSLHEIGRKYKDF